MVRPFCVGFVNFLSKWFEKYLYSILVFILVSTFTFHFLKPFSKTIFKTIFKNHFQNPIQNFWQMGNRLFSYPLWKSSKNLYRIYVSGMDLRNCSKTNINLSQRLTNKPNNLVSIYAHKYIQKTFFEYIHPTIRRYTPFKCNGH